MDVHSKSNADGIILSSYMYCFSPEDGDCIRFLSAGRLPDSAVHLFEQWYRKLEIPARNGKIALLDLPVDSEHRLLLSAWKNSSGSLFYWAPVLEKQQVLSLQAYDTFYHGIFQLNADFLQQELAAEKPIRISFSPDSASVAVHSRFTELLGWQMIGNPEKSVSMIARMLPAAEIDLWFGVYFLAVNPEEYAAEYTTIAASELPKGSWNYGIKNTENETSADNRPASPPSAAGSDTKSEPGLRLQEDTHQERAENGGGTLLPSGHNAGTGTRMVSAVLTKTLALKKRRRRWIGLMFFCLPLLILLGLCVYLVRVNLSRQIRLQRALEDLRAENEYSRRLAADNENLIAVKQHLQDQIAALKMRIPAEQNSER